MPEIAIRVLQIDVRVFSPITEMAMLGTAKLSNCEALQAIGGCILRSRLLKPFFTTLHLFLFRKIIGRIAMVRHDPKASTVPGTLQGRSSLYFPLHSYAVQIAGTSGTGNRGFASQTLGVFLAHEMDKADHS